MRIVSFPLLLVLALLAAPLGLSSCSSEDESPLDTSTSGSGGGGEAGAGGAGGGDVEEPRIRVAATSGSLPLSFGFSATGAGKKFVGDVEIAGGFGSIALGGEALPAAVYERQPFGEYVLYQALAAAPDRLYAVWLYCQEGALSAIYYEGTDGTALEWELATGSCEESVEPSIAEVALPALDMPLPPLLDGYSLEGPDISLDGASPGEVRVGGSAMVLLAFEEVDCTTICGTPGWREIHALLWEPASGRVCFAILYLFGPGEPIYLTYSLTLPDLTDPAGLTVLEASWLRR